MNQKWRKKIYKFPILYKFSQKMVSFGNSIFYFIFNMKTDNKKRLYELKNAANKKRCFIIGNGPSLTEKDLELLKNEICFASNKCFKIFDKTNWRPNYYVVQDRYSLSDSELNTLSGNVILIGDYCYRKHHINRKVICFHEIRCINYKNIKFSYDIPKGIYGAFTVTYTIIQLAVYMGFKEIYLLGMDHNYPYIVDESGNTKLVKDVQAHFFSGEKATDFVSNINGMTCAYEKAKRVTESLDVNIYNVTRGGKLEIFERKALERILYE